MDGCKLAIRFPDTDLLELTRFKEGNRALFG